MFNKAIYSFSEFSEIVLLSTLIYKHFTAFSKARLFDIFSFVKSEMSDGSFFLLRIVAKIRHFLLIRLKLIDDVTLYATVMLFKNWPYQMHCIYLYIALIDKILNIVSTLNQPSLPHHSIAISILINFN